MQVPAHVKELDETYVSFGESSSEEAVRCVGARFFDIGTVHVQHVLRFIGDIEEFRHAGLHAEGHFVLADSGLDFWVDELGVMLSV